MRDWVHWLKEQFDQNDLEIKKIIQEELGRQKPKGEDSKKPKFKIKIRINSESHSIRAKELNKWNQNSDYIKLFTDGKNDLICDIFLSKAIHINGTWSVGWGIARAFIAALNIATKGFFWWHIPKDRSRYYEEMWDLERNMKMGTEIKPQLSVNFKDLHWVLKENDLAVTSMVFYYITSVKDKEEGVFLNDYLIGLSLLAKIDIHLRLELNAFSQFYKSLKSAFRISGDWDGKSNFPDAVRKQLSVYGDFKDLDKYLSWGEDQEKSIEKIPSKEITLTEVFGMKLYAELYIEILAKRVIDLKKSNAIKA